MTPSQQAKAAGLKSLQQVSELTGVCAQTLTNWHRNKPELFRVVIAGCLTVKPSAVKWWCGYCDMKISELHVTHDSHHAYCGNPVKRLTDGV